MAYIGKTPITGNFVKLDAISVVNGQAGYTMNNGGSAFTDYENVNQFLVSLNGILQAPTDSFTVSGSTLTFASNLATGDVIDFVIVLGSTLDIGTPSDATVTQAKTNFVSTSSAAGLQIKGDGTTDGTLQLNCSQNSHGIKLKSPAHSAGASYTLTFPTTDGNANEFLQTNGSGVMTWAEAGGGDFVKLAGGDAITADSNLYGYYTSDYRNYKWVFNGVSSSSASTLRIRIYKSGGAISSSDYHFSVGMSYRSSGSHQWTTSISSWNDDKFDLCSQNVSSNGDLGATLIVDVFDPQSAQKKNIGWSLWHEIHDGSAFVKDFGDGISADTSVSTGLNVYSASGNFGCQHWALYGMKV